MVLLPGVHVLRVRLVEQKLRYCPDKRPAPGEHIQHGIPLFIEAHAVVQLHPAGYTRVVAGGKVHPVARGAGRYALAGGAVPDGGVGNAGDFLPPQPAVFPLGAGNL